MSDAVSGQAGTADEAGGGTGAEQPAAAAGLATAARCVAITGEIPFSGCALLKAVLNGGGSARVLCPDSAAERAAQAAAESVPGGAARTELVPGNLGDEAALARLLEGATTAALLSPIGLYGRLYRADEHVADVGRLVKAANAAALRKLVYHSAVCANTKSGSQAFKQAVEAEPLVDTSRCEHYIVRTQALAGKGDGVFEPLVGHARKAGLFMGVASYGDTPLQALHVDDFAHLLWRLIAGVPQDQPAGVYNAAGRETITPLEIYDRVAAAQKRTHLRFHAPHLLLALYAAVAGGPAWRERLALMSDLFPIEEKNNQLRSLLGRVPQSLAQTVDTLAAQNG